MVSLPYFRSIQQLPHDAIVVPFRVGDKQVYIFDMVLGEKRLEPHGVNLELPKGVGRLA